MNTRDEINARDYAEAQERLALDRGEPLPPLPAEPVTRSDVLAAVSAYATLNAAANGTPSGGAAWGNAHRAYCRLQDVLTDFGRECAFTGEVL